MTAIGPFARVEPSPSSILAGQPVSSLSTWYPIAAGSNWLNAIGTQLIPGSCGDSSKNAIVDAATGVWHFRCYLRPQTIARVWSLWITAGAASAGKPAVNVDITCGGGASQNYTLQPNSPIQTPITYIETLAASASGLADLTVSMTAHNGTVTLNSVSCWEMPRGVLAASANDHGVSMPSERQGAAIYAPSYPTTAESMSVFQAVAASDPRRSGQFHWSVPATNPITRVGAYVAITGLGCSLLTRKLTSGATKGTVYWAAYAKVSGSNGDVQIVTSHSGVSDSVNLTTTSYAWTTPRAIQVDCEDLTATDGRQSSSWDEVTLNIRGNSGGTISVAAVSVFEEP